MATIKKIQIRTDDGNDYGTILHPETSADMVIDEETGQTLTAHLADTSAHGIDKLEKMLVKSMYSLSQIYTGEFGDMVVSTNATIPLGISTYNNLTINSGATLTCLRGVSTIFVKDTLTLNGVISANGLGAKRTTSGTRPYGGAGGGIVIVIANRILGTGTITANGEDGQTGGDGFSGSESPGHDGMIYDYTIKGGGASSASGGAGGTISFETKQRVVPLLKTLLPLLPTLSIGGASGGTGEWRSNSLEGRGGGGGGAGLIGDGGAGSAAIAGGTGGSTSGGGGGGGGGIFVLSLNGIPSIKLSAKGGNGGNGTTDGSRKAGGGGGGGGGFVGIWAPSSNAIIDVTGGSGGKNASTSDRGEDGKPGLAYFKSI